MEIKGLIKIIPKFIKCNVNTLLENANDVEYTGFYLSIGNINSYFFKIGNNYYIVKSSNFEDIEKSLLNRINSNKKANSNGLNITHNSIGHCTMGIIDLMNLYNYNNDIKVSDFFFMNDSSAFNGNYSDFLHLVRNVLQIERDMEINNIDRSDKYSVMKFIYNKYKMLASYWDPVGNYGEIKGAGVKLRNDNNRVVCHPYDFLGLINDNYATCEGMARGLVELYRYFGIDAEYARNELHGVCKIILRDKNEQRKVTYIDLSKEVTRGFQDNKYEYRNGVPVPRRISNRIAQPNSYDFFMKANAGVGRVDSDYSSAVDFRPQIKIVSQMPKHQMRIVSINEEKVTNRHSK